MKGISLRYAQSEEEAEDMLQESFIKIFKALDRYKDTGPLGGWIRVITVNTAIEFCRRKQTRDRHYAALEITQSEEEDNDIIASIQLEYLLEKIRLLPEGYRLVFNLYAIEGFNHREIGEKLGISEGTSKSQFARARRSIREMIEADELLENKRISHAR